MKVVICIDASSVVNPAWSPRLGILAIFRNMMDKTVNIIHFTLTKSNRACKSVFVAELFALVDGYYIGYTIAYTLGDL